MLSFEVSAIDLILVIAVIVLFLLHWTKTSKSSDEQSFQRAAVKVNNAEKNTNQNKYEECPRGFGYIKRIADDGTVSERCLGCYRIMDCYTENEEVTPHFNTV